MRELVTMDDLDALLPRMEDVPDSDRLVREIRALSPEEVVRQTKARWPQLKRDAWAFALLVERMGRERLFRPYASLSEWARRELQKEAWVVSKHRTAAQYVLSLDPDDRRAVMESTPPATLAEAGIPNLAEIDRREALRLAKQGLTQQELRQAVRARLIGRKPEEKDELRTIHKVVSWEVWEHFQQALHVVRFLCQTPHPGDAEVIDMLCTDFLAGVQIPPETLERFPWEDIITGKVACFECGATNPNLLEAHHVVPRSHLGADGPLVWLCMKCHRDVTDYQGGGWRERLERWMSEPRGEGLKAAVEQWLAGRSLDALSAKS